MKRTTALPAKLVRSAQKGAYRRARLFTLLHRARPAAWVSGPPGARAFLASRTDRPSAMARLRAGRTISLVEWDASRLTASETAAIARTSRSVMVPCDSDHAR